MGDWHGALEAFGLTRARLRSLPKGWTNASVRASCGDCDVVLRRHGGLSVHPAAVERKQMVVAVLHERGAPVAPPFAAGSGRMAVVCAGDIYSASRYIQGTIRTASAPRALGTLLGAYHSASSKVPPQNVPLLLSSELLEWLASEFGGHAHSTRGGVDWRLAHNAALRLEHCFRTLDRRKFDAPVWVHGDARRANIVHQGAHATFIDFDFLHYSERGYDIGTLLDDIAWTAAGTLDDRITEDVLEGYAAAASLSGSQRGRVLAGVARRNLAMLWYIARRHPRLTGAPLANARRALDRGCAVLDRIAA